MLFNSTVFVFLFLPIAVAGFALLAARAGTQAVVAWLTAASLFFYAWWDAAYLWILVASIAINFTLGQMIGNPNSARSSRKALMLGGVAFNLVLLGYYKYAGFLTANLSDLFGQDWTVPDIVLPLGISFFTFQQVAYLVDRYQQRAAPHGFLSYCLFVSFFPQLIAGPIVHHKEIFTQLTGKHPFRLRVNNVSVGLTLFAIGLFKKVVIADTLSRYASPVFFAADQGAPLAFAEAWIGCLAYTFQLYFDFSAYSDMAVGLARLFGLRLPINFFSPYKATSIIEFWRRWHITLSRFLRDYVYIPLGGNAHGATRKLANILATMVLGGLWHGAGWNFVLWGGIHGCLIVANHLWRASGIKASHGPAYRLSCGVLTFVCVAIAWVPFRAETMDGAFAMLAAMGNLHDLTDVGATIRHVLSPNGLIVVSPGLAMLPASAAIAFLAPNAYELLARYRPAIVTFQAPAERILPRAANIRFSIAWGLCAGLLLAVGILRITGESEFLYFQF